jgi:hypothetical protein
VSCPGTGPRRYASAKRFGLEGGETLIPGMKALIDKAADLGVDNVVIGMPHRGGRCHTHLSFGEVAPSVAPR